MLCSRGHAAPPRKLVGLLAVGNLFIDRYLILLLTSIKDGQEYCKHHSNLIVEATRSMRVIDQQEIRIRATMIAEVEKARKSRARNGKKTCITDQTHMQFSFRKIYSAGLQNLHLPRYQRGHIEGIGLIDFVVTNMATTHITRRKRKHQNQLQHQLSPVL